MPIKICKICQKPPQYCNCGEKGKNMDLSEPHTNDCKEIKQIINEKSGDYQTKIIECFDYGVPIKLHPKAHNRKRCDICSEIRNRKLHSEYRRKQRLYNPIVTSAWGHTENKYYDRIEAKIQKMLDTWTWLKLPYTKTPLLDELYPG